MAVQGQEGIGMDEAYLLVDTQFKNLGVDSFSIIFLLFKNRICFPWVLDGFLKRLGSRERMEMVPLETLPHP